MTKRDLDQLSISGRQKYEQDLREWGQKQVAWVDHSEMVINACMSGEVPPPIKKFWKGPFDKFCSDCSRRLVKESRRGKAIWLHCLCGYEWAQWHYPGGGMM